jgi:hypothetical protein
VELAAWPGPTADEAGALAGFPLESALRHVANILQVPRVLALWGLSDEPFLYIVLWENGGCRQDRKSMSEFGDWTAPEIAAITFASINVSSGKCITLAGAKTPNGPLISELLVAQFQLKSVASALITGANCNGRVFMLDKLDWSEDDLTLTEIVASRIGIELDHYALRLELVHDDDGAADEMRQREERKPGGVVERARDEVDVIRAHRRFVDEPHRSNLSKLSLYIVVGRSNEYS